ncbi:MAG: hypothetical protein DBX38_02660 [Eubacteriales Family XIII. Incertae Sedis bacterium]|nr:MAG: hypothetical protein DBX38_02660 [Clostridiales Family XIII bacterium]
MIPAEQWYEYQESYKKYGFDMKPRETKVNKQKPKAVISAKDKTRLIMLIVFLGTLCIGIIVSTAYAAKLQYDINTILNENNILQGEIDNLNVAIKKESNIAIIEEKATSELGMIYPQGSQIVRLGEKKVEVSDFAMTLKEQAYN